MLTTINARSLLGPRFLGLLACVTLTGCFTLQTYPGPQLPREQVATLKTQFKFYAFVTIYTRVVLIDGQSKYFQEGFYLYGDVELLPGLHELEVVVVRSIGSGYFPLSPSEDYGPRRSLSFSAEAGHVYKLHGNWNSGDSEMWVVDEETGRVVAGKQP